MLFFLVSLLSFLLLLAKPKPQLPSWVGEMRLLSVLLFQEFLLHSLHWLKSYRLVGARILKSSSAMFTTNICGKGAAQNVKELVAAESEDAVAASTMTVLDLPELALEMILERLSPQGLLNMADVCTSLRERCTSDYLWERHFREKWGRVAGRAVRRRWEAYSASVRDCRKSGCSGRTARSGGGVADWVVETMSCVWPCSWFVTRTNGELLPDHDQDREESVMAWYLAMESGRFWFPAQVFNREQNAHVGFMLSCYDAELNYDSQTDTFHARYPPHGQRATNIEEGIEWDRLRAAPADTPANELHASGCLNDLRLGDHIEIQWRRNKEFPYGWWYGVVGHLESCNKNEHHCNCHNNDTVVLEFMQYSPDSRWRRTVINRKDHREEGNESDGFYGGIRKLKDAHEISTWRKLWPKEILE